MIGLSAFSKSICLLIVLTFIHVSCCSLVPAVNRSSRPGVITSRDSLYMSGLDAMLGTDFMPDMKTAERWISVVAMPDSQV